MTVAAVPRVAAEPILLPPADPALPRLPEALDEGTMIELLGAQLRARLSSCRPTYIRYKPGTNCLVQYQLAWEGADPVPAHLKLFADGKAARLWSTGSLQALDARATRWNRERPVARVAHLPELDAIFQRYPVDLKLPSLTYASSPAGAGRVVRRVLGGADRGGAELVRYKAARKALLRYRSSRATLYVKLYSDGRGALVFDAGRALGVAGVRTPRPLAYLRGSRLLVQAEADGRPLREFAGTPEFTESVHATGEALAQLQTTRISGAAVHGCAEEADALLAAARAVATVRPDLGALAQWLAVRAADSLAALPLEPTTAHGDFSVDQVVVAAEGPVLLDIDEISLAHPLLDVGNFLAHLSVRDPDDPARAAFLDGYGPTQRPYVPLFEAGAILKLAIAPFRNLEPDWPAAVEHRLTLAERRLAEFARSRPLALLPFRDAKLPQVGVLVEPTVLANALEGEVYGEPVEVRRAEIVRHKPSRRCLLRYDLLVGSGASARHECLYGKTFASERGPRVFRTLVAIAGSRACGPAVDLPEPIAYLPSLKLLLQREVRGTGARERLLGGDETVAERVAEALHALHCSGIELERQHSLDDELGALHARVTATFAAGSRSPAHTCLARLENALDGRLDWRFRPIHRDIYHDQVLVTRRGLGLLDFDDAAMSEPAVDVANVLAHLRLLALEEPSRAAALAAPSAAFVGRYQKLDAALDPLLLRLLESATLLRLACIHAQLSEELVAESLRRSP
jgi:aminoglycoside phosphotransferase (APT) family kinase protein